MFDLFAESSDSDGEDNSQEGEAIGNKEGFTVVNPSVDDEGYYQPKTGEMIQNRYRVTGVAGKGVFSCVVKAVDTGSTEQKLVAIKIIRNKFEVMH